MNYNLLQTFPDQAMKKNLNKVSVEFDKFLAEEFQNGADTKPCDSKPDNNGSDQDINSEVVKNDSNVVTKTSDHKI